MSYEPWKDDAAFTNDVYILLAYNISGDVSICPGGNTDITIDGSQAGTNYEYRLYRDNVFVSGSLLTGTGNPLLWNVSEAGPTSVIYIVKATNTLSGCVLDMTGNTTISFYPVPAAIAGTDRAVCLGVSTQLGDVAVPGNTYSWTSVPVGFTSSIADPIVSPLETTTYTLVETTVNGCFASNSVTVTVNPLPDANAGLDQDICPGTSTQIGAAAVPGNTYSWTSDPVGFTSTQSDPMVTPAVNTIYTLVETNTATGCTNSNSVSVNLYPLQDAPTSDGDITECSQSPIQTLTASATPPANCSVVWYTTEFGATTTATPTLSSIGTIGYWAASQNDITGCISATRTLVTLTINESFVANTISGIRFCTLQDAIDAASASDILEVETHTFVEDITIPAGKTGLEIVNAAGNSPIIVGVNTVPVANWPLTIPNIEVLANGVKIHGISIQSPAYVSGSYASGMIIGASNVEIYDNSFLGWAGNDANGDEVGQCIQTYASTAIPGVDISGLYIHNNTFTDNFAGQWGYEGIYVNLDEGAGNINISNNQFSGDLLRAITIERSEATIQGNTILTDLLPLTSTGALEGISVRYAGPGPVVAQNNIAITSNEVGGSAPGNGFMRGIRVGVTGQALSGISLSGNTVSGNTTGVLVRSSASGVLVNTNKIYSNSTGLENEDAATLDATGNFWGSATGPTVASNPCGTGDPIVGLVSYEPWKDDAAFTNDVYLLQAFTVTGDITLCPGENADITLDGSQNGANYEYSLYRNSVLVSGSTLSGTAGSLVWNVVEPNPGSFVYTVLATNTLDGCTLNMTGSATVTVNDPLAAPIMPADQTICYFTAPDPLVASPATGGSSPYGYQWESSPNGVDTWSIISGENTLSFSPGFLSVTSYYRIATIDNGIPSCGSINSTVVTITVNAPITAPVVGNDQTICYNTAPASLTATAATGGNGVFAYQWQGFIGGLWTNVGTNSLSYQPPALTSATQYRLIALDLGVPSCGAVLSNTVTITVQSVPDPGSIGSDQTICEGSVPAALTSVADGTGSGIISYQWEYSVDGGGNWNILVGETGATYAPGALTQNTMYQRTTVSTLNAVACMSVPTAAVTITVNTLTANTIGTAQSICSGTTASLTGSLVTGDGAITYQWQSSDTEFGTYANVATAGTSQDYTTDALTVDTWFRRVATSSLNGVDCSSNSNAILISIDPILTADVSIAVDANPVCDGTLVTFTATPTNGGSSPTYQWFNGASPVGSGTDTYSYIPVDGDVITVEMTSNATPCLTGSPATSNAITMTVNNNLAVSVSVSANTSNVICAGTQVTFTASPVNGGTSPAYQWQLNGIDLPGEINSTYITNALVDADAVTVVLTSSEICTTGNPATSDPIIMTVNPILPVSVSIIADPAGPVCDGTPVTFTATPVNGGSLPAYQWQVNGVDVTGEISSTYTTSALLNGDAVSVTLTSNETCQTGGPATSNVITMTVRDPLAAPVATADQTICYGSPATALDATAATGGSGPFNYQWQSSADGTTNWTDIGGANSLTYDPGSLTATTYYQVIATDAGTPSCGSVTSNVVGITVRPQMIAPVAGSDQTVCYFTAPVDLTSTTASGGTGPFTYQWQSSPNGVDSWTDLSGETNLTLAPGSLVSTTYYRLAATDQGTPSCGVSYSNVVTITVNDPISAPVVTGDQTICNNDTPAQLTATASTGGNGTFSYQWQSNSSGTWVNVGTNSLSYQAPALLLTTQYRIIATDLGIPSCGNHISNVVTVVVQSVPDPGSIGSGQTICDGSVPAALTSVADGTGSGIISYQWEYSTDGGGNWTILAGETSATYAPGALTQNTMYQRTTVSTLNAVACMSVPTTAVTITVNTMTANTIGTTQSICSGSTASLTGSLVTGNGTISYQWQSSDTEFGTYADVASAGTSQDYTTDALVSSTWFRRVVTSNLNGLDCISYSSAVLVTVNPVALADFSASSLTPPTNTDVIFTDMSTGSATTWSWSFSPSTVIYTGGTDATSQNPQVQFTATGSYSVTLTVNGGSCENSITKTAYIHAGIPGLWTGTTSSDWNTASNWDNNLVPDNTVDVVIPATAPNWPVFTGLLTVGSNCNSITLNAASSQLTISLDMIIMTGHAVNNNGNIILLTH